MFGGNEIAFLCGCSNESAPSQVVRSSEQAAGSLMDCGHGLVGKEVLFYSSDGEMMDQVSAHLTLIQRLQVSPSHHARCQRLCLAVHEAVDKIVLAGKDDRQDGS